MPNCSMGGFVAGFQSFNHGIECMEIGFVRGILSFSRNSFHPCTHVDANSLFDGIAVSPSGKEGSSL
eukprot:6264212-Heterocapsa_arctica.AAC.1